MIISRMAVQNIRNIITYDQQTTYNERIHIQTRYFFEFAMNMRAEDPRDRVKKVVCQFFIQMKVVMARYRVFMWRGWMLKKIRLRLRRFGKFTKQLKQKVFDRFERVYEKERKEEQGKSIQLREREDNELEIMEVLFLELKVKFFP